ncbi:unnamed protein product [Gongylonema pulchrum]|uniref:J domain-containing protein n=1 Tax=Gongylonema pulchrum TaxID=637853 RepID=A0A183DTS9_9BILA|nr:unnamed protein product [Gongylonema pulchrum]
MEKEKIDSKNAVEEYVYYIRDKLSDTCAEFITKERVRKAYDEYTKGSEKYAHLESNDMEKRVRKAYDEYTKGSEKYAHLESNDMEKVISAVEEKKKWLDEQRTRQEKRKKTEPPVIFVHQIKEEQQVFFYFPVFSIFNFIS